MEPIRCRFCGSNKISVEDPPGNIFCECGDCHAFGPNASSQDEAISLWNGGVFLTEKDIVSIQNRILDRDPGKAISTDDVRDWINKILSSISNEPYYFAFDWPRVLPRLEIKND